MQFLHFSSFDSNEVLCFKHYRLTKKLKCLAQKLFPWTVLVEFHYMICCISQHLMVFNYVWLGLASECSVLMCSFGSQCLKKNLLYFSSFLLQSASAAVLSLISVPMFMLNLLWLLESWNQCRLLYFFHVDFFSSRNVTCVLSLVIFSQFCGNV